MEAQAEALRAALTKLDEVEALMLNVDIWDEDAHRPLRDMRRRVTLQLSRVEGMLWTRMGLPGVPRAR